MTIRLLLTAASFMACVVLTGAVKADENQSDPVSHQAHFDISKYTVVVENQDYYRYQSCLGLVYDSITVLVPEECGYRDFSNIVVYSSVDDFDEKNNPITTMIDLDRKITGRKWVALYLETKLEKKKPAKIATPDLNRSEVWSCYYLATKNQQTLINRRKVEISPETNSGNYSADYFYVLATDQHKPDELLASYIPGAILFNEQQEVVGFSLNENSIYLLYARDKHKFYRAHFSEDISRIHRSRLPGEL